MLEEQTRASAFRLKAVAHARVQKLTDHPGEGQLARWIALQHLAAHDPVETSLGVRRHPERKAMPDTWLEVIRVHPLGQSGAGGERPPDLLPRLRNQDLSLNRFCHSLLL